MQEWLKQNLIALLLILVSAVGVYTALEVRMATVEHKVTNIEKTISDRSEYLPRVDKVEYRVDLNSKSIEAVAKGLTEMDRRVSENTVAGGRMAVAIENLVKVTSDLNSTVASLTITAAKLEEKINNVDTKKN